MAEILSPRQNDDMRKNLSAHLTDEEELFSRTCPLLKNILLQVCLSEKVQDQIFAMSQRGAGSYEVELARLSNLEAMTPRVVLGRNDLKEAEDCQRVCTHALVSPK